MSLKGLSERSGGGDDFVRVSPEPIDPAALLARVADPACGASVLFLGTVRDHSAGKTGVTHLEYEAYDDVVEAKIAEIVAEARERWPVRKIAAVHRVGRLDVEEIAVGVTVSSPHRADAFDAGRYVIDELKARVPIWKKEHWPGGAEWVREDLVHGKLDAIPPEAGAGDDTQSPRNGGKEPPAAGRG